MFQTWSRQLPLCSCVPRSPPQRKGKITYTQKIENQFLGGLLWSTPFQMAELQGALKKWWEPSWLRTKHPEKIHNGNHFKRKASSSNQPFCHRIFSELCRGENIDQSWQRPTVELGVLFLLYYKLQGCFLSLVFWFWREPLRNVWGNLGIDWVPFTLLQYQDSKAIKTVILSSKFRDDFSHC